MPIIFGIYAYRLNREKNFDGVFIYSPPLTLGLCKFFLQKTPSILNIQDIFPQHAKDLGIISSNVIFKFFQRIQKIVYKKNNLLVCQSKESAKYIANLYPEFNRKISYILNWQSFNKNKFFADQSYEPSRQLELVYCGNIGPAQDLIGFISNPIYQSLSCRLNIYGEGVDKVKLVNFIKQNSLVGISVHDAVPQSELSKIFSGKSMGLVTLAKESSTPIMPGKILTYAEHGLPVLAFGSKHSKLSGFLEKEKIGLFIDASSSAKNEENSLEALSSIHFKHKKSSNDLKQFLEITVSPDEASKRIDSLFESLRG
jgi:hypothetical protein